jgi:hypothetical protein
MTNDTSDTRTVDGSAAEDAERDSQQAGETTVTRRGLLAGVAAVGVIGSLTHVGTQMALSDRNTFEENRLESGNLELGLAWTEYHNGRKVDGRGICGSDTWATYHDNSEPVIEFDGDDSIEPGDEGTLEICLRVSETVESIWMRFLVGSVAENGVTATEEAAGDTTTDVGELHRHLDVAVKTHSDCERARESEPRADGTIEQLGSGPLETGVRLDDSTRCVVLEWHLPDEVPATILTDVAEFSVDFAAVQSRPVDAGSPWANSDTGTNS